MGSMRNSFFPFVIRLTCFYNGSGFVREYRNVRFGNVKKML